MPRTSADIERELADLIEQSDRLILEAAKLKGVAEEIRRTSKSAETRKPKRTTTK